MFTRPTKTLRPPLAVPPRPGPAPRSSSHLPGLWVTRHQRGFTHVRPSGLPLACVPGWNGSASASSLSSAPRSYPRRTSGRGLALNTGQELRHRHHVGPPVHKLTRNMPPRVARPRPSHPRRTTASALPSQGPDLASSLRENNQRPNEQCSRPEPGGRARHPSSDPLSRPPAGARSVFRAPQRGARGRAVLTCQRLPGTESAVRQPG